MANIDAKELSRLVTVRNALLRLHKVLLDGQRASYEKTHGKMKSASEFLQLAISDPAFEWLHRFSELVVEIDEATDGKQKVTAEGGAALLDQARRLIEHGTQAKGVGTSLDDALRTNAAASMIHAELAQALD